SRLHLLSLAFRVPVRQCPSPRPAAVAPMPFRLRIRAVRLFRAALIQHFPARKENDMTTAIQTREPNSGTAGADQAPLRPVSGLLDITRRGPAFVRTGGVRV